MQNESPWPCPAARPQPFLRGGRERERLRGRGGCSSRPPAGKGRAGRFSGAVRQAQTGPAPGSPSLCPEPTPAGPGGRAGRARAAAPRGRSASPRGGDASRGSAPPARRPRRVRARSPREPRAPGSPPTPTPAAGPGGAGGWPRAGAGGPGLRRGTGNAGRPRTRSRDNCRKWPVRSFRGSLAPPRALEGRGLRQPGGRGGDGSRPPVPPAARELSLRPRFPRGGRPCRPKTWESHCRGEGPQAPGLRPQEARFPGPPRGAGAQARGRQALPRAR